MLKHVEGLQSGRILLLTECSMGDNIAANAPQRELLRICSIRCPHMNEITLEETLESLRQKRYEVELPGDLMDKARASLDRMIGIG